MIENVEMKTNESVGTQNYIELHSPQSPCILALLAAGAPCLEGGDSNSAPLARACRRSLSAVDVFLGTLEDCHVLAGEEADAILREEVTAWRASGPKHRHTIRTHLLLCLCEVSKTRSKTKHSKNERKKKAQSARTIRA